jgi:threonyl-tRNA synthetase
VVGDEEVNGNSVSVRRYGEKDTQSESLDGFVDEIQKDIASYSREDNQ